MRSLFSFASRSEDDKKKDERIEKELQKLRQ
jgi:hypothetical protein